MPIRKPIATGSAVGAIASVGALLSMVAATPAGEGLALATAVLLLATGPVAARASRASTPRTAVLIGLLASVATFVTFGVLIGIAVVVTWAASGEPVGGLTGLWLIGLMVVDPLVPLAFCAFGAIAATLYRIAAAHGLGPSR